MTRNIKRLRRRIICKLLWVRTFLRFADELTVVICFYGNLIDVHLIKRIQFFVKSVLVHFYIQRWSSLFSSIQHFDLSSPVTLRCSENQTRWLTCSGGPSSGPV